MKKKILTYLLKKLASNRTLGEISKGKEGMSIRAKIVKSILEESIESARWTVERFANDEDAKKNVKYSNEKALGLFGKVQKTFINMKMEKGAGNILVNTGINELWTLVCAATGTRFDNTNAYLGVGDSSTAAADSQTDLQAATNKLRVGMNGGYPTYGTSQKATWQSDFTSAQANYAWEEFAVFNASSAGVMLNRKVSAEGTKTAGQTWRLSLEITLS